MLTKDVSEELKSVLEGLQAQGKETNRCFSESSYEYIRSNAN